MYKKPIFIGQVSGEYNNSGIRLLNWSGGAGLLALENPNITGDGFIRIEALLKTPLNDSIIGYVPVTISAGDIVAFGATAFRFELPECAFQVVSGADSSPNTASAEITIFPI